MMVIPYSNRHSALFPRADTLELECCCLLGLAPVLEDVGDEVLSYWGVNGCFYLAGSNLGRA